MCCEYFAIKNAVSGYWVGGKRKITLFIKVHFSLQVAVLSNAVFKFLNCFVSLKKDNERI